MLLKTFYIAFLSFFIFLVPTIIIAGWDEFKGEDFSFVLQSILQIVFYSIPMIGLGYLVLLAINLLTSYMIRKKEGFKRLNFYLIAASTIALLPIIAFVLFDYSQRGRYFEEKTFASIFLDYSPLLIWAIIAIYLNWRKVIKRLKLS
jgi:hypothetical protein